MEADNDEREQAEQAFEYRHQEALRDRRNGADELVLRHLVDNVDQVHALGAVAVANVDAVHAWTVSTRRKPGQPSGCGARRSPTLTAVAFVPWTTVRCVR